MVLYSQLPIYRDSYQLLLEIYQITNKFSRDFKYTLVQDMKRDVLALFRYLYEANMSVEKIKEYIDKFLTSFELLKVEMRLCTDLKILSMSKLAQLSLLMDNISRQAHGWRKI